MDGVTLQLNQAGKNRRIKLSLLPQKKASSKVCDRREIGTIFAISRLTGGKSRKRPPMLIARCMNTPTKGFRACM